MRTLKIFGLALLMIFVAQGKTFAEMPEISAGETYFDLFKGVYVLKDNVHVVVNNHGFKATVTADEALVSVAKQKCWAEGNVKLMQENISFSCERAYLQWQTKTAEVTGKVKFENKKSVAITSDTAVFNWQEKIVDFYGKITLKAEKKVKLADGVELDGKEYQHVKYNVVEDKILALDKTFDAPEVVIPSAEE
ncbi:MAG: hypothetical protein IJG80_00575 [Selenomonadaceae bacterium]|nr:hypothetical protein [Selenomonadaceae bacterium]MBQ3725479.1 hypothetical protein [Selenomonadaceae bacterium]MBQ9496765.1 hypothetical protein [Selenomonadaceae bacterium]